MGPYDYTLQPQNPTPAVLQGLQVGMGLQQMQQQQQQQQALQDAYRAAAASPTADNLSRLMLLDPKSSEGIQRAWTTLNTSQQQNQVSDLLQIGAALKSGRPDIASQLFASRADAMDNSNGGQETPQSQALRLQAQLAKDHPEFALGQIQALLAANPNGKQAADTLASFGAESRAQALQPAALAKSEADASKAAADASVAQAKVPYAPAVAQAEASKAQSEAASAGVAAKYADKKAQAEIADIVGRNGERWARLGLDRDRLTTETQLKLTELQQHYGDLPEDIRKDVTAASTQAVASQQSVSQFNTLANKLDGEIATGKGFASRAGEWLKAATGNQDALTGLRQEYTRLMSQGVMKMLPPGPASDKDVALAREGFPKSDADAAYLASFLRGMAKINAFDAAFNNAKSEWMSSNRSLGPARTDMEVYGVKVPKGSTFSDFSSQFLKSKADQIAGAADVAGRGYMRFAGGGQ